MVETNVKSPNMLAMKLSQVAWEDLLGTAPANLDLARKFQGVLEDSLDTTDGADPTGLLGLVEASALLNVPKSWLRRLAKMGRVPSLQPGGRGRFLFDIGSVRRALRAMAVEGSAARAEAAQKDATLPMFGT